MPHTPLAHLGQQLATGALTPLAVARDVLARANANASSNTYLHLDPADLLAQAEALPSRFPDPANRPPLFGVPVSLKDCFDLQGTVTTFGSRFYAETNPPAPVDSAMARRLRQAGCLVTGKSHLHPLAFGITGENPDFGDCLQPRDPTLLTGGSSSGAAASVQEGSALVGIGTDTGGSVRIPAALCGLVGFRASHSISSGHWPEVWTGASHLAPTFDTPGFLLQDARDAPIVASSLFLIPLGAPPPTPRIAFLHGPLLATADPDVLHAYTLWQDHIAATVRTPPSSIDPPHWTDAPEIFVTIQAHEAAAIHRGHFIHFPAPIADRLRWGESLSASVLATSRDRHLHFREGMADLLDRFDLLILPSAPIRRMRAGDDLSAARPAILRYTAPFSLAGLPVLTLPGELLGAAVGTGIQIAAAPGADSALLAFGAALVQSLSPL